MPLSVWRKCIFQKPVRPWPDRSDWTLRPCQWKSNGSSGSQSQQPPTTVPLHCFVSTARYSAITIIGTTRSRHQAPSVTRVDCDTSRILFRGFVQSSSTVSRFRGECLYCHKYGHHIAECRNCQAREADSCILSQPQPSQTSVAPTAVRTPVATIARFGDSQRDNASSSGSSSFIQPPQRPHNPVYVIDREESSSEILNSSFPAVPTPHLAVDENKIASCVIGSEVAASLACQMLVESFGRDVTYVDVSCSKHSYCGGW